MHGAMHLPPPRPLLPPPNPHHRPCYQPQKCPCLQEQEAEKSDREAVAAWESLQKQRMKAQHVIQAAQVTSPMAKFLYFSFHSMHHIVECGVLPLGRYVFCGLIVADGNWSKKWQDGSAQSRFGIQLRCETESCR